MCSPLWRFGQRAVAYNLKRLQPRSISSLTTTQSLSQSTVKLGGFEVPAVALRDACSCPRCVDQSTKQRNFIFSHIPPSISASVQKAEKDNWHIQWTNDIPGYNDHTSHFTAADVERLRVLPKQTYRPTTMLWTKDIFEQETQPVSYGEFINEQTGVAKVLHLFRRHGLVFITGVPKDEKSVSVIAQRIAQLRNTFYGETWDVRSVPQAKNVAYTSVYLGFHMDLLYLKESPGAQFLHCLENTCTGGESRFVDAFKAYDTLCVESPQDAETLSHTKIRYRYDNDGHYYTCAKPVVHHEKSEDFKRVLKGNQSNMLRTVKRMYWSPPFVGSIKGTNKPETADYMQAKVKATKALSDIFEREDLVYETKMEAGTCVLFDNLRVLHARNAFDVNSGSRWLRGCYLDAQDVISKELSISSEIMELESKY